METSACRVHRFGPPEVITFEKIERPQPGDGEVLVRVVAAGAGPWDTWIRAGKSALPQPLPLTLGSELSGLVESVGPNVMDFAPGDPVFGASNARFTGAYAGHAIVSSAMIAKKPAQFSDIDAASIPVAATTAWQALFEQAHLTRGQSVLIHGAGGNVGAFVVQLARRAGLRAIGTANAHDLGYVRSLGADEALDFRAVRFESAVTGVDAVIDLVGGETQRRSFPVLRPGGILVSAVSQPSPYEATRYGVRALFFLVTVTTAHLTHMAAMIGIGELTTNVGTVLSLAEARTAHEMLEGSRARSRGKIILRVDEEGRS